MSEIAVGQVRPASREPITAASWAAPDWRRSLQLGLAAIWLLDAVLQYQSFMYSKGFAQMIGGTAAGNPHVIASPITWNANLVQHHLVLLNTIFATIQLAIGIGIAFRPTLKVALAGSVLWSLGVWWFGEGLGGILNGGASPLNGAPGAVLIYALIAVLLWPADRDPSAPFIAGRAAGTNVARAVWAVFWAAQIYFTLQSSNLTATGLRDMIGGMASGEPSWLAAIQNHVASAIGSNGIAVSVALAVVLAVIAAGVFLPARVLKIVIIGTVVLAALIWVIAQAFGGILTGGGTDPNSGPLLALFALLYWPLAANRPAAATTGE
ncbi:MAG TPA: hypothetical protein VMA95_03825 [Streptosporangiaceae bacterium]|nr:hypothetical protein [Streptosporangiaceae bacterium]